MNINMNKEILSTGKCHLALILQDEKGQRKVIDVENKLSCIDNELKILKKLKKAIKSNSNPDTIVSIGKQCKNLKNSFMNGYSSEKCVQKKFIKKVQTEIKGYTNLRDSIKRMVQMSYDLIVDSSMDKLSRDRLSLMAHLNKN
jgi:hypothetical protein